MVFYRKYRPQTISELDSAKLRETLTAVLSRPDIPHAFLLTGPKGLGKTSTARIIAKAVNCENKKKGSIEPCGTCDMCVSITNGSNIDILEIDGASNRGIDEIRDLRDKVKLAPSRAKKKVYIIDEVHMLTTEAFNALLKTIEEPPAHVMFIFCTTEPQKVPATILSRCFHVAFPRATDEDIVRALSRIVKAEKLTIDEDALLEIATMADGGFRDATKILEELVLVAGDEKIDKTFIESHYKTTNISKNVDDFLEDLYQNNTVAALTKIGGIVDEGTSIKYFTEQILQRLHYILLSKVGLNTDPVKLPEFDSEDVRTLNELFSQAYQEIKYAVVPQLPLELAVVAWCSQSGQQPSEGVILDSETNSESGSTVIPAKAGIQEHGSRIKSGMTSSSKHSMDTLLKKEKNLKVQSLLRGEPVQAKKPSSSAENSNDAQEELTEKTTTQQFMENLIYKVKPINFSVAGVLRGCSVKRFADGEVVLETQYKFHKEKLDEGKTREVLEKAIKEITGKSLKVMVELKS